MNIRITLGWPTPGPTQRPIAGGSIELRLHTSDDSLPWTEVAAPNVDEDVLLSDYAPGLYDIRGFVLDEAGARSTPVETQADIPFDPPSPFTALDVTLE